ncbi:Transport inhibitor response 1-like protein [Rhynchospora pubera]|uniref:Transport inhibitor response 1-like protein n=1 Tax=Rhynchospora pubera TaxID=906938 RepID=A0AAV8BQV9_9POAL|nr:Transport inhibitor response 1-like protein [Rhynchospora pubera]
MDEGFGAIVMSCKKLTRLSVSGLLTDKAFEYNGRYGKLLGTLSVAFAAESDLGLKCVFEGRTRLLKLEIRDCPFGDSALISGLPLFYNMRFLWMSSCNLSVRGCREVAQSKPNLVVEVIEDGDMENEGEEEMVVDRLYMYRSLVEPRTDAPPFVKIL